MSMFDTFDRTGSVEFPYTASVVFRAVVSAVQSLPGMQVHESNDLARQIFVKTGVTAFSWGERVTISVLESGPERSRLQIASAAKTNFGSATTHGKNRRNVQEIISKTTRILDASGDRWAKELAKAPALKPSQSVADEIGKLANLREQGILSDLEFESQKKKLLGL